jgi:methionyl-tRNA formyltransferase
LRLLLFADPDFASSMRMLVATLQGAAERDDVEIAAIVDAGTEPRSPVRLPSELAGWGIRTAFNLETVTDRARRPLLSSFQSIGARWRTPVLVPGERSVNDPSFVETVRKLAPDATLALMVGQIFRAPLLEACRQPINYHDGLLPHYRGVAASGWSIYRGEEQSGFTFHQMVERVDRGPIVAQGLVQVSADEDCVQLEYAKTQQARRELDGLFDRLAAMDCLIEQSESGSYFSRAELRAIRRVEHPEAHAEAELHRRVRSFGSIELSLNGASYEATALRRVARRPEARPLAFTSADGVWLEPRRVRDLPPALYRSLATVARRYRGYRTLAGEA